jgi:hypothetical protein
MPRPRLVFIFPLRRCGSNSLRLHLNCHPDIFAPYPIHIHDFMHLLPNYGNLSCDANYLNLITDVIGYQNTTLIRWTDISFDPLELFDILKDEPRNIHRIIGEMYLIAGEKKGAKIVIDKSQDSVLYAQDIKSLFPDALIIDLIRDPRAQINSMNKAIIHDFDTISNVKTWIHRRQIMETLYQAFSFKILTIKYENFILYQKETLTNICKFLRLDFCENMTFISKEAIKLAEISCLWENNSSPPIKENIDKFLNILSKEEIKYIEFNTQKWIDQYQYSFYYPLENIKLEQEIYNYPNFIHDKNFVIRNFRTSYLKFLKTKKQQKLD